MIKFIALFFLTISSYANENWTIDDSNQIYTSGKAVNGHKFGFIKEPGNCNDHLLFISWSTYSSGLEKFEGQDTKVFMDFDDNATHTTLKLVSTYNFADIMTLAMFSNVDMPEEFMSIVKNSKNLKVTFVEPAEMLNSLDFVSDTFDIEGFSEKLKQAQKQCSNKTPN